MEYSHGDPIGDHITITQTDLDLSLANIANTDGECNDDDGDGATECKIDEVGLFDANGRLLSHASFSPSVEVNNGDTVDMELTITLGP